MRSTSYDLDQLLQFLVSLRTEEDADISKWVANGTLWNSPAVSHLSAKEMMRQFSEMGAILGDLWNGVQKTMVGLRLKGPRTSRRTKKLCFRRTQGILAMPYEILCMIAREVHWLDDATRLSRTCKKLRQITLSCPELWTKISSRMSDSFIEKCLSRSKESPLDIHMEMDISVTANNLPAWRNFTTQIFRHSHRWKSFCIESAIYNLPTISLFAQLSEGKLSLPKLQSLTIRYDCQTRDDSDEALLSNDNFHFYSSWTIPNLTKFEFTNFIPRAILPPTTTTIMVGYTYDYVLKTALLLNFLRSYPQTRHLSLELLGCEFELNSTPIILDEVESFSIKISLANVEVTGGLMHHIGLPSVEAFTIDMDSIFNPPQVDLAINAILSGQEHFDKITKLKVIITRMQHDEEYRTGKFLTKLPNLKALSIDASYENHSEEGFWYSDLEDVGKLPQLETVNLSLDDHFYDENIVLGILRATKVEKLDLYHYRYSHLGRVEDHLGDTMFTRRGNIRAA